MSILLVIQHLQIGGAQTFMIRLANALARHGHQVYLWDIEKDKRNPAIARNIHPDVHQTGLAYTPAFLTRLFCTGVGSVAYKLGWKSLQKHRLLDFFQRRYFRQQLQTFLRTHPVDVLNTHMAKADYFVSSVVSKVNVPWVVSTHGCYDHFSQIQASSVPMDKAATYLPATNHIVLAADKNEAILRQLSIPTAHYTKLWYGFEAAKNTTPPAHFQKKAGVLYFGMVSRAMPEKGWEEAIRAVCALVQKGYAAELVLVGESAYADSLRQKYPQPFIHFAGATSEPIQWVQQFDVCLLPSRFAGESCPNSIIEYLFCHKPVIATDIGEIRQMLEYEGMEAGFVLPLPEGKIPQDRLTECMEMYLTDTTLLEKHSQIAAGAFRKFDMQVYLEKYVPILQIASH